MPPASAHSSGCISSSGSPGGGYADILNVSVITPWKVLSCGGLGVECFQPSLGLSDELCVSSNGFNSPGYIQVCDRMCHRSIQTLILVAPCCKETPWLPTILNILADVSHQ